MFLVKNKILDSYFSDFWESLPCKGGNLDLLFFSYAQSPLAILIHAFSLMLDFSCLLFFAKVER